MGRLKELFLIHGVYPVSDLLFHTHVSRWFSRIKRMLVWRPEQISDWQTRRMRELVANAYQYSPYYRQLFDSLSLKPEDIRTVGDLEKIPPLTKEIIRERYDDILLRGKPGLHYRHTSTGGSTGNPTRYVKDNDSWGFDNAFNFLMWKQTGYRLGDRFLALGSSSLFPTTKRSILHDLYYGIRGKIPFNAMDLSKERLEACVDLIRRKHIHYIYGYASSIFLLAKYVEENHLESTILIKACFPTSEILTDTYRSTMERVFHCVVSDMYGAHDGGIVAHCIQRGFKVGYNCIVQIEDGSDSGPALLTDVTSTAFPFIRYKLGDELTLGEGYSAFYNGQVLDSVLGRTSDVIELENGRVLTGPGFTVLFSKLDVQGYRIYKSGTNEITVEIVKGRNFTEEQEKLMVATMHKHAGDDCSIRVKYADKLQNRVNGKNLFFLSDNVNVPQ